MYGIILVELKTKNYYNPVDLEVPLALVLMVNGSVYPYNNHHENFALMGRYGSVMLVNGQTNYQLNVNKGQVVCFIAFSYLLPVINSSRP